jgi:hypothetical protein
MHPLLQAPSLPPPPLPPPFLSPFPLGLGRRSQGAAATCCGRGWQAAPPAMAAAGRATCQAAGPSRPPQHVAAAPWLLPPRPRGKGERKGGGRGGKEGGGKGGPGFHPAPPFPRPACPIFRQGRQILELV